MGCTFPFFLVWLDTITLDPQRKDLRHEKEVGVRAPKMWVTFWKEMR